MIKEIRKKVDEFITYHNRKPTTILLGSLEYGRLMKEIDKMCYPLEIDISGQMDTKIYEMLLHVVKRPTYFKLALE